MQILSNIPKDLEALKASNDYAASLLFKYPSQFGLLAMPTACPEAASAEIERATKELHTDGFAATCHYDDIYLGDDSLRPVWAELNRLKAVVFVHPDAYAPLSLGRPSPLIEVAFETTRTVIDTLYAGVFRDYPEIKFILAHCDGALLCCHEDWSFLERSLGYQIRKRSPIKMEKNRKKVLNYEGTKLRGYGGKEKGGHWEKCLRVVFTS